LTKERPADVKCIIIRECTMELYNHPAFHKISDDSSVDSELKLLLARANNVQWSVTIAALNSLNNNCFGSLVLYRSPN